MPCVVKSTLCGLAAALLYATGRGWEKDADALKSVESVRRLEDLPQLIEKSSGRSLTVSITGKVGSDTPIKCERSELRAVIFEEEAEQHYLENVKSSTETVKSSSKKNDSSSEKKDSISEKNESIVEKTYSSSWERRSARMLSTRKEVPWYLDDGTGRVTVVGACEASSGLPPLTVASKMFEGPVDTLLCGTLHCCKDIQMLGLTRVERVLPVGKTLTVVGQAIKDNAGTIRIQKPHSGPFYVSENNIDQIFLDCEARAWLCWFAAVGFIVLGLVLK